MSLNSNTLVDIPDDEGVHVKTAGLKGEKYVYKHVQYFRDTQGKPRNKSKAIGKYDADSGKMLPNNNYFEMYNVDVYSAPARPSLRKNKATFSDEKAASIYSIKKISSIMNSAH